MKNYFIKSFLIPQNGIFTFDEKAFFEMVPSEHNIIKDTLNISFTKENATVSVELKPASSISEPIIIGQRSNPKRW